MLGLVRYESQILNSFRNEGTASLFGLWGCGKSLEESLHEEESGV